MAAAVGGVTAATSALWLTAASGLSTLLVNTEHMVEDAVDDGEGDAEEEDAEEEDAEEEDAEEEDAEEEDDIDWDNPKSRLSKRQYSHMDGDEGMRPFRLSTRRARLINSSPVQIFDSTSELTGVIFDANLEPQYVAVAPTAITSTLSAEGQKPWFEATRGDFAIISLLFSTILLWLIIFRLRARKQRRAGRMDCEAVGPYSSLEMETKRDLESGSVQL